MMVLMHVRLDMGEAATGVEVRIELNPKPTLRGERYGNYQVRVAARAS
jgi:hypothetical protein